MTDSLQLVQVRIIMTDRGTQDWGTDGQMQGMKVNNYVKRLQNNATTVHIICPRHLQRRAKQQESRRLKQQNKRETALAKSNGEKLSELFRGSGDSSVVRAPDS